MTTSGGAAPRFRRFAAIDWSGAVGPRQKGIAVAICEVGSAAPVLVQPGHIWSRVDVLEWVLSVSKESDILIGFDLSPSLPFVDRGAYFPGWTESPANARQLWRFVEDITADDPHLSVPSFVDHAEASRHFRRSHGRCGDLFQPGSGRLRVVEKVSKEQRIANPYSCFNLVGAAQVGKSSLSGMRLYHRLDGHVPLWPYDPKPTSGACVVEIYTSIAAVEAMVPKGRAKMRDASSLDSALAHIGSEPHSPLAQYNDHATDALLTAAWLRHVADNQRYWRPERMSDDVARTEGWTFGVA